MDLKLTLKKKKQQKKKEKRKRKKNTEKAITYQFSHTLKLNHEPKNKREIYDGV